MNKFVFHSDPGHGWIQVPKTLIAEMGIRKGITGYSYQDAENLYLEEDLDAGVFVDAYKAKYGHEPEISTTYHKNECFVRNLRGA